MQEIDNGRTEGENDREETDAEGKEKAAKKLAEYRPCRAALS